MRKRLIIRSGTRQYQIGVRLEEKSKGGSAFMHRQVEVGSLLTISTPNNLFALDREAQRHVFIAGGIGITPFLAQLNELRASAAEYVLHYAFRSPEHGALCVDLLAGPHAERTQLYIDSEGKMLDIKALIAGLDDAAHLYVCRPRPLIDAVIDTARQLGVSDNRVHWEPFAAATSSGHGAFSVTLARSGRELWVEAGMSILKASRMPRQRRWNACVGRGCVAPVKRRLSRARRNIWISTLVTKRRPRKKT